MSRRARSNNTSGTNNERKVSSKRSVFSLKRSSKGNEYFSFYNSEKPRFRVVLEDLNESGDVTGRYNLNGAMFNIEDPVARFDFYVEKGIMTEKEADEAINKIPDFILEEARIDVGDLEELD
jgi:hypothetical protein